MTERLEYIDWFIVYGAFGTGGTYSKYHFPAVNNGTSQLRTGNYGPFETPGKYIPVIMSYFPLVRLQKIFPSSQICHGNTWQ